MGIKGLLMNTKSVGESKHITEYSGQAVGVDGYSWLHKSLHRCSIEVA